MGWCLNVSTHLPTSRVLLIFFFLADLDVERQKFRKEELSSSVMPDIFQTILHVRL